MEQPSNNLLLKKERYVTYALTSTQPRRNTAKVVVQVPAFFIPADLEWDKETPNISLYSSSQLVAPGTHTTGPKNHAAEYRLRTQKYEGWNFNSGNYVFTTDTK
jgi:hypothetical protein